VGFPHVRVGHRQAPIPKPLISLAGRGFCFGARKSRNGRSAPGGSGVGLGVGRGFGVSADNRERLSALRDARAWRRADNAYGVIRRLALAPGGSGLAWARAVASVYWRITANGYSPYDLPWAGCGDGYRFAQRHPTRVCPAPVGADLVRDSRRFRRDSRMRSPTPPHLRHSPCRSAPCARIAGRAREGHGADGYRFAQRHPTGLHPVGADSSAIRLAGRQLPRQGHRRMAM